MYILKVVVIFNGMLQQFVLSRLFCFILLLAMLSQLLFNVFVGLNYRYFNFGIGDHYKQNMKTSTHGLITYTGVFARSYHVYSFV